MLALCLVAGSALASDLLDKSVQLNIPAQKASSAIIALSKQADVQILMPSSFSDRRTQPLKGRMSLRAAIQKLLGDHGIEPRQVGERTVAIGTVAEVAP